MASGLDWRRKVAVAAKAETNYLTFSSPAMATDAIRVAQRPTVRRQAAADNMRNSWVTGGLGRLAAGTPNAFFYEVSGLIVPVHGAGVAYSATDLPNVHPFLQAGGYSAALDSTPGSETYTYTLTDSPAGGVSMLIQMDGYEYAIKGGVVTQATLRVPFGSYPLLEMTVVGAEQANPVEQAIEAATYPTIEPPHFENASLTIQSFSPVIREFELQMNPGGFSTRGDGNVAGAHSGYRLTGGTDGRDFQVRPTVEYDETLSNFDPEDLWDQRTQRTFDATIGDTQYNRFLVDVDDMRVVDIEDADLEGLSGVRPTFQVYDPGTGNEECTITFN